MLEELIAIHEEVIANTPTGHTRYLYDRIDWEAKAICLVGGRGVGKTTLMCQFFINRYQSVTEALYLSADNISVLSKGLFAIAQEYFKYGGQALFIDEIHKYPNWAQEIKNILDTFRNRQIVFSASSSLDLQKSKFDLSRRVVYHELRGLSFREYLNFIHETSFHPITFDDVINKHSQLTEEFRGLIILKYFKEYLAHGYFPFFLEGKKDYLSKVANIIEKVIFEDIAVVYNLKQTTLPLLKKLLWLVATSKSFTPNIQKISKNLGVSREIIYNCLDYLNRSGLLCNVYHDAAGMKLARKPEKIFLENSNLLYAISGSLQMESDIGNVRETFFVNQVSLQHRLNSHDHGDFIINSDCVIEVGGKSKTTRQIKQTNNSYLAVDEIEYGFGNKIPLYLFGFLY